MALVVADRVKATTITTGTGTYTIGVASTGFENFSVIGNGNTTYYCCTDGTDFEVGIGTYTASGTTLARTTILQSSNGDAAVNWSAGSKTIFVTQPADKAVYRDASGYIAAFDGRNLTNVDAQTLDSLDSTQFLRSDTADTKTSGDLHFSDNVKATFGDTSSPDLEIYHDGTRSYIQDSGDGDLRIIGGGQVQIRNVNDTKSMANFFSNGKVELRHDGSTKLETTSTGATVTGVLTSDGLDLGDNERLRIGASPTSDLQIWHDGTNSNIVNGTGSLIIADTSGDVKIQGKYGEQSIVANNDGSVELYHDNSKKLETISGGIEVTGGLTANVTGDGTEVLRLGTERPWAFLQRSTGASSSLAFRSTVDAKTFDIENEDGGIVARFISDNSDGKVALYYGGSQKFITTSTGSQIDGDLTLKSTDTGATENPTLDLYRDSASPADQDIIGHINFSGENDADEKIVYGEIQTRIRDMTDGTENGAIETFVETNGSLDLYTVHQDGQSQFYKDVAIISSDAGATENPTLDLYRNSASPADNDVLGHITFTGENSAGEKIVYGEIDMAATDVTDGTEDGRFLFNSMFNGTLTTYFTLGFGFAQFNKNIFLNNGIDIVFEGATGDAHELTLTVTDPTADRTITLPDASGTVLLDTGNQTLTGVLTADGLDLGDNEPIRIGASQDLTISHDGSNSRIKDVGTGSLLIGASFVGIQKADGSETAAKFFNDGSVELYHDNSKKLETTSTGATVTGTLVADGLTMGDSNSDNSFANRIKLGASGDLKLFHSGTGSFISDTGTGSLFITGSNTITFQSGDYGETYATFNDDGAVSLRHDNSVKFSTTSTGATVTGVLTADGLDLGDSEPIRLGASQDLEITHTGNNSVIVDNGTGNLFLQSNGNGIFLTTPAAAENMLRALKDGAVELYYDNSKKLETTSTGAEITGNLTLTGTDDGAGSTPELKLVRQSASPADFDYVGGLAFFADNSADENIEFSTIEARLADATDGTEDFSGFEFFGIKGGTARQRYLGLDLFAINIYNDQPIIYRDITSTHDLRIIPPSSLSSAQDITLPDASGTVLLNAGNQTLTGDLTFPDNEKAIFGSGSDLEIYHDGSNSYIDESGTGNLYIRAGGNNNISLTDNAVYLYYNGSTKLQTTSDGASITGDLQITSTDAGATENPTLDLYRNSASPANNDKLAHINFSAENDAGQKINYAEIEAQTTQVTDGNEYGAVNISAMINGTFTQYYQAIYGENRFNKNIKLKGGVNLLFQGATEDANETTLTVVDPTADRTITLPDSTGTVLLTDGDGSSLTNVNATTLDSVDSTSFLRSDAADTKTSGDLSFSDNVKAIFGAGSDLQIYHSGTHSFIDDAGVGNLYIRSSDMRLQKYTGENMIVATADGAVTLYYDNSAKLATTSTGVDVTGGLTTTAADGSGTLNIVSSDNNTSSGNKIAFFGAGRTDTDEEMAFIKPLLKSNSGGAGNVQDGHLTFGTFGNERMRIASSGNVGIGTTLPEGNMHIFNSSAGTVTAATDANELVLESSANVGMSFLTANSSIARIKFGDPDATNSGVIAYNHSDDSLSFNANGSERMRVDSGGIDITGGFTATDGSTITTADNSTQLTLKSTDADATEGPRLDFVRDSASPADNDHIGIMRFLAEDSAGTSRNYAEINAILRDVTVGTLDAELRFYVQRNDNLREAMSLSSTDVVFNESGDDVDFRIESDGNANMFRVNAETNRIGIGKNPTQGVLDVNGATYATSFHGDGSNLTNIGGGFDAGTLLLFQQTAAPTGWTKQTTHNDKALRVVSGTAGTGGSSAFTTALGTPAVSGSVSLSGDLGSTSLSVNQIASHQHGFDLGNNQQGTNNNRIARARDRTRLGSTNAIQSAGGGGSHNHTTGNLAGSLSSATTSINVQYVDVILAAKD